MRSDESPPSHVCLEFMFFIRTETPRQRKLKISSAADGLAGAAFTASAVTCSDDHLSTGSCRGMQHGRDEARTSAIASRALKSR